MRYLIIVLLQILAIDECEAEGCSRMFLSHQNLKGEFTSPGYPQHYPSQMQCRFTFNGTSDERIRVTFEDFDLEPGNSAGCLFDYVDVFTVDRGGRMELERRICGSELPQPLETVHHRVELVFKSDYASARKGFKGRYEFIDETWQPFPKSYPSCGPLLETGVGGEILSPNYPGPYPNNIDCTWMIRVQKDRKITLNFVTLDLGQSVSCDTTFVAIYDGFGSPNIKPAMTVCGQLYFDKKNLWQYQSTTYRVVIRFRDQVNEYGSTGFQIAWAAVHQKYALREDGKVIEVCNNFLCRGGEYCIDGVLCIPLPSYCIDASLRCNSIPNCGAFDHSDEELCLKDISLYALAALGGCLLMTGLIVACVYYVKRSRLIEHSSPSPENHNRRTSNGSGVNGQQQLHRHHIESYDVKHTITANKIPWSKWNSPAYCSHDYQRPDDNCNCADINGASKTNSSYTTTDVSVHNKVPSGMLLNEASSAYTTALDVVVNNKHTYDPDGTRTHQHVLVRQDSSQTASSAEGIDYRPYTACSYVQPHQLICPASETRRRQTSAQGESCNSQFFKCSSNPSTLSRLNNDQQALPATTPASRDYFEKRLTQQFSRSTEV